MNVQLKYSFAENSFDIISLIAASNVAIAHTSAWIFYGGEGANIPFWSIIAPGPAVAVIFAVSGYLVAASYERSKSLGEFFLKRLFRIYPPLIIVVILPSLIACISGKVDFNIKTYVIYLARQIFFAAGTGYTPADAIGDSGLWTIFCQVQFYILTPVIIWAFRKISILGQCTVISIFVGFNLATNLILGQVEGILRTVYGVSCIPYLYIFLLGVFIYLHREKAIVSLIKMAPLIIVVYIMLQWVLRIERFHFGYYINPFSAILIICAMFGFAYRFGQRGVKNDISYGIYLWHIPVVDFLHIICQLEYSVWMFFEVWIITIIIALISSKFIETPALKLSKKLVRTCISRYSEHDAS